MVTSTQDTKNHSLKAATIFAKRFGKKEARKDEGKENLKNRISDEFC